MPKHFLNCAQVGTASQQMGGEGMAQQMGLHGLGDAGLLGIFFDQHPEHLPGDRRAALAQE